MTRPPALGLGRVITNTFNMQLATNEFPVNDSGLINQLKNCFVVVVLRINKTYKVRQAKIYISTTNAMDVIDASIIIIIIIIIKSTYLYQPNLLDHEFHIFTNSNRKIRNYSL